MKKETQKKERNEGDGKMRNERHEMVTDNVSANHQFRNVAKMIPHEEVAVSKMETTTPTSEKSSVVGNSAKMREALEKVRRVLHCAIVADILKGDDVNSAFNEVTAALSAPPRNCDVGTAEEQDERFDRWCDRKNIKDCWGIGCRKCLIAWAQMPYKEGGAIGN